MMIHLIYELFFVFTLINFCCNGEEVVNKAAAQFLNAPISDGVYEDLNCEIVLNSNTNNNIPSYLAGSLYRTGAGYWDPVLNAHKNDTHAHLFFGLAMVHAFHFNLDENDILNNVEYFGRFQQTGVYEKYFNGYTFRPFSPNNGITIRRIKNRDNSYTYIANDDLSLSNSFDPYDVRIRDAPYEYNDFYSVLYGLSLAPSHAQTDLDGTIFHYIHYYPLVNPNGKDYFRSYYIKPGTNGKRVFSDYKIESAGGEFTGGQPMFQHSLGLTEHYMIICEIPYMMPIDLNLWELLTNQEQKFFDLVWVGEEYDVTTWYIVDKYTGEEIARHQSTAFMTFHFSNAYEMDDNVIIDMFIFEGGDEAFDILYIDRILNNPESLYKDELSTLVRWVLPINNDGNNDELIEPLELSDIKCGDFPMYSYDLYNTKPYEYVYFVAAQSCNKEIVEDDEYVSHFLDTLIKEKLPIYPSTDKYPDDRLIWMEENQFVSEPIFVADPDGSDEDDGVILSLNLDGNTNVTYLLILDAKTFDEIARVKPNVDETIPYTFHGRHYSD